MCRSAIDSRIVLSRWCLGVATCLAVQCFATTGKAQTPWTNPGGGFWHTGSNWAGGSPPGPAGTAIFNLPNTYNALWNNSFGDSVNTGLVVGGSGSVTFSNTSPSTRTYSVIGNSVITGSGSSLTVGSFPGNTMQLTSGGMEVNSDGQVVATAGSRISTPGLITAASNGSLGGAYLVANAGGIIQADSVRLGDGGFGSAQVNGVGSQMITAGNLLVGSSESGSLDIQAGGFVQNNIAWIGHDSGSLGTALITGNGSQWVSNLLHVGFSGTGLMNVWSGGQVGMVDDPVFSLIGSQSGSNGAVDVSDAGSTWNAFALSVGSHGQGVLSIRSGGTVNNIFSGTMFVGEYAGGNGTVNVSGTGSTWNTTMGGIPSTLRIGDAGTGLLNVHTGGLVNSDANWLGNVFGGSGTASISGTGSRWNTDELEVGRAGTGTLSIASGGSVVSSLVSIGTAAGGNGSVNVAGPGSVWNTGFLFIGNSGTGALNIQTGGLVTSLNAHIGGLSGVGTALVSGSGAMWQSSNLFLQNGTLNIDDSGSVFVFGLTNIDSDGQINNSNGSLVSNTVINQPGGEILGHGSFSAIGGWSNSGFMAFRTGVSNVYGAVNNLAGGTIFSEFFGTTCFHGDVVHNGFQIAVGAGSYIEFQGTVSGAGNYFSGGLVTMNGAFRPGNNSPSVVSFASDLSFGGQNTTYIELGGLNPGEFDQLLVGGDLSLGNSQLDVSLVNGFSLASNVQFLIADVGGVLSGQFSGLGEGSLVGNFGGTDLFITYNGFGGNAGVGLYTSTNPVILGDVNGDGVVNLLDVQPFVNVLTSGDFQQQADINQDGVVNLLDVAPFVTLLTGE